MVTAAKRTDAVWYPESDDMGEHELQKFIVELLRPLVVRWLAEQHCVAHTGANQFFYWVKGDPKRCRAPDLYVVDGVPQDIPEVGTWKVWEGHAPTFVLEVCSSDWQKDYVDAPAAYDAMGAEEVIVFDPGATARRQRRVRWQIYRRMPGRGTVQVLKESGDRVWSQYLGCYIRAVDERGHPRVRLGTGDKGDVLFPTYTEAERAAKEAERAAKEAAVAKVAQLEQLLDDYRAGRK